MHLLLACLSFKCLSEHFFGHPVLTGGGDFPCIECSRHFISQDALEKHRTTKIHRRRLKELRDEPYSQKEADAAAGLGTDNGRSSRRSAAQHQKHQETAMIDLLPQAA